jgi:mannose-6-phosphate isomerase-like protein (cupin superfamily)
MDRRLLLKLPLLAPTLLATKSGNADRPNKGFKVESGKDRSHEELLIMGGRFNRMVSSEDTDGDLLMYDTVRHEKGGPAFHLHHNQDEWFYVISGEFIIKVGDDVFTLKAGDSAFAPRTIPHTFANVSDGEARMLVLFQPAGSMENFFKEMSKLGSSVLKDQAVLKDLWKRHGMELVGPPLKF